MLSIGEFSKICQVTPKALRYYADVGLLKPEVINPESGYRYYSINQLKRMLLINRLKLYNFSIDEIKSIVELEQDQLNEKLCSELNRKIQEAQNKISYFQYILQEMNYDIINLSKGMPLIFYLDHVEVSLVETEPMNILYIRKLMTKDDYIAGYLMYYDTLYKRISADNLTLLGKTMTIYHATEFSSNGNDTEFAIPIKEAVEGTRVLSGGLCAKSVLHGPYWGLSSIYVKMSEWVQSKGFELYKPAYEIYVVDLYEVKNPDELVTEVYFPVRKKCP